MTEESEGSGDMIASAEILTAPTEIVIPKTKVERQELLSRTALGDL